ncbi:MAG TPA: xanthine dehydrogenase family protein molybdopterin-binding subunit [Gemmatimonadales bacterium]|nr:xanthine dehydrogenase family protein molybdopterin-binding subunit [Gemmatimonadales bacterium]
MTSELTRRDFVKAGLVAGAGLTLTVSLEGCSKEAAPRAGGAAFAPNAWIRIGADDTVTVIVDRSEMGQGVSTSLPMLVAEELDAEWATIRYEFAPANEAYYNPLSLGQLTGGSTSIRAAWRPLREAAAKARLMLVGAAAGAWGIAPEQCRTESGAVIAPDGRSVRFGAVAARAATLPIPERVTLKKPGEFRLIGKPVPRLDLRAQVTGKTVFGIDAGPADALIAVVARCPVFGGTLRSFDDGAARTVPGVKRVLRISNGVAVVAAGYWAAKLGRDALKIEWDEGAGATLDDAAVSARLTALAGGSGHSARKTGDLTQGFAGAAKSLDAVYEVPYLAHASMEPMNCTADVRADSVTVWAPTQFQAGPRLLGGGTRGAAAKAGGVSVDRVTVHTTNLGGGFGRRAETDFVVEACEVSRAMGAPVKLIWSREDDIRHDQYRPAARHVLRAGIDASGAPVAWSHRIISPSIVAKYLPGWLPTFATHLAGPLKGGVDASAIEGAVDLPFTVPNFELSYSQADLGVPVGFWRSVANSHTAFALQCFVDELALLAGKDPVAYRRDLLARSPRNLGVLNLAAERAGWDVPAAAGRFRGIAVHESFGSFVAQVAEVSVAEGGVRVHRVVCAVDCGQVVNPDTVAAQIEGAIVFGLTAALKGRITLAKGRVTQSNFHDYKLLTMREMPVIEVHLVASTMEPGGVGEIGTPPIAPAVANAVFAATGKRIRTLPIAV